MTTSDHQTFTDFWQVMSERNAIDDILNEASCSMRDALYGLMPEKEINTHIYYHIPPLEVNTETEKKIIDARGGIDSIKEFMAYEADWDEYKNELEADVMSSQGTEV